MKATAIAVPAPLTQALPTSNYADAYCVVYKGPGISAKEAARAIFDKPPIWALWLMRLRNRLVGWLGLKTPQITTKVAPNGHVGLFPIVSETRQQIVLGFDDRHLDFRIIVITEAEAVVLGTVVKTHNWLGRSYLALVLPFHHLLSKLMLNRARFG